MPVFGSNNTNACGPCSGDGGESSAQSLFLGTFPSLANLSTLHPNPQPGSRALITVAGAADDVAYWDEGANAWSITGSNNKVRLFGVGITEAAFPSDSIINFTESLTVLPDEIVILSLIRVSPPPAGSVNSVHTKERYIWGKGKGTFAPIGNVLVGVDVIYIGNEVISTEDISNIPNTVTRVIGAVPEGQTLEQYINNLGPGDLIDLTDETKSYFLSFELEGVTRLAAFAGTSSAHGYGWYGSSTYGAFQATPGDFSIIGADLAGPVPDLATVTAAGSTAPVLMRYTPGTVVDTDPMTLVHKGYVASLNTPTLVITAVNVSTDPLWDNRILHIDNGAANINLVVNHLITTAFTKVGTGNITITAGTGKTLHLADSIAVCNGIKGSTFLITPDPIVPNRIMVFITNR